MSNNLSQRDASILRHMIRYCRELDETIAFFGNDESEFERNSIFRNAVSMPIQQIGELAKHLSDDFIASHPEIPWRQVKGMRDWFAHQYLDMDTHVVWITATLDIPSIFAFCEITLK